MRRHTLTTSPASRAMCALACVLFTVCSSFGSAALAQSVPNDRFSANRFTPAPGAGNYIMVDGAVVAGHLTPTAGLFVDYAHRPFVLFTASCKDGDTDDCQIEEADREIVSYQLTFSAMATLSISQRLQLGLVVPAVLTSGESFQATTEGVDDEFIDIRGGDAFGLGDPRLNVKVRLVGENGRGFYLSAVGFVTAPLGEATAEGRSIGDESLTGGGHLVFELLFERMRFGVNAGGVVRPERELLSTEVGPELTYGVGGSVDATTLLRVIGEVTGATQLSSQLDENPIEARVAGELTVGDFALALGGGAGILSGVGVPNFRAFAGAAYRPAGLDSDGDGVRDSADKCPSALEDDDNFQDDDGCPDEDNDGDNIADGSDRCPDTAEDPDGKEDTDGCPDLDNDGDGVQDGYDSCPSEPEDKDGDRDEDGCPDDDRDRDGVPDGADKCPNDPEDTDGFGDEDGCPETDFDGDGVSDDEDQCPDEPEDKDGVDDADGCADVIASSTPPPPPDLVKVTCDKIEVSQKIFFKSNSAVIETRSHELLNAIASALHQAKHVKKVRVEGHTDDKGNDAKNLKLSQGRAESVRDYLVNAGISAERLEAQGFGETRPIADNKARGGRDDNRRVEFVIVDQSSDCASK
jgi:OmpA-OmpF porin, OOP family